MNHDRRSSFRCVSPSSQEPAILRAGRKDASAQVMEESAEGMGVRIEGAPLTLKADDLVSLTTASRRVSAQVVYVREDEQGQRLGLVKLRDLGFAPSYSNVSIFRHATGIGAGCMRFTLVLAACLGMFLGGVVSPIDWSAIVARANGASAATSLLPASRPPVAADEPFAKGDLPFDERSAREFARLVRLSPRQRERIGQIVEETISTMSLLHANRADRSEEERAELGMQTLHASWKQIQKELTPDQKAKWRELTAM